MNNVKSNSNLKGKEELDDSLSVRHAYDIDVFEIYDELKKKYPNNGLVRILNEMDNSNFFEMLEASFVKALNSEGIILLKELKHRCYILPSSSNSYSHHLGWKLLIIDPYKIEALLSYQSQNFLGNLYASKDNFLGLVEFCIYDFVNSNNYLNENIRLEKIMSWVQKQKQLKSENEKPESLKTGFESTLDDKKIQTMFDKLMSHAGYIAKATNLVHFKAIFTNGPLPLDFVPVKWILLTPKRQPHKTALREFLKVTLEKIPPQDDIDNCITDKDGHPIYLAKPKNEPNTQYWTDTFSELLT